MKPAGGSPLLAFSAEDVSLVAAMQLPPEAIPQIFLVPQSAIEAIEDSGRKLGFAELPRASGRGETES